jgi:hypothetical protein
MDQSNDLTWVETIEIIKPHVVQIETPKGCGSGFLVKYIKGLRNSDVCTIATASHVISQTDYWDQPIKIRHFSSNTWVTLSATERIVRLDQERDSATIEFDNGGLPLPKQALQLVAKDNAVVQGVEVGWMGFPSVSISDLCFFSGKISAYREVSNQYLVDGVGINGVSGGPAFLVDDNEVIILGVVSAYKPNLSNGDSLPGLMVVQDVSQFHDFESQRKLAAMQDAIQRKRKRRYP